MQQATKRAELGTNTQDLVKLENIIADARQTINQMETWAQRCNIRQVLIHYIEFITTTSEVDEISSKLKGRVEIPPRFESGADLRAEAVDRVTKALEKGCGVEK